MEWDGRGVVMKAIEIGPSEILLCNNFITSLLFQVHVSDGLKTYRREYAIGSIQSKTAVALGKGDKLSLMQLLFADPSAKEQALKETIDVIDGEIESLCSKKDPSILRTTPASDLNQLTTESVLKEIEKRAPSFYRLLKHLCFSKGTKYSQNQGKHALNSAKIVSTATVLLKSRCKSMMAWAAKNALALQYGGCSNMVRGLLETYIVSMGILGLKKIVNFYCKLKFDLIV